MSLTPHSTASRRRASLLLLAAACAATACSDDVVGAHAGEPARITLTSAAATSPLTSIGDTALVTARVADAQGTPLVGVPVRWSLSRADVVTRDAEGTYRAVANGRATIVAEVDPGITGVHPSGYAAARIADSVVVEVRQRAARLTLAPVDTAFTALGSRRTMHVDVTDARGVPLRDVMPTLAWSSADAGIVQVDGAGLVRSLAEGTSRVSVQAAGLSAGATFTVRPRLPHTSCMVYAQRRQTKESCVTLDLVMRDREGTR